MANRIHLIFRKVFPGITVEGEFVFEEGFNLILGPSGSGKTTVLRVISGLEKPEEGYMACCGKVYMDTREGLFLPPQKRRIGIVFQDHNLLPHLTVRENIEFALRKSEGNLSVDDLMERFGIKGLEDRYPHQISGGERQRVAIIRALAYEPKALLLDEPFSSLDFDTKLRVVRFLKSLDLNIPVVLVTHDPLEASLLAGKVFVMSGGKKVREGGREIVEEILKDLSSLGVRLPGSS
ncbi:MAG: ATP-binding cassette domain-containing protein [Aquificota bacterium]|nr:ATP-binding cassette domain-containing protein [Aquificota bacterium]